PFTGILWQENELLEFRWNGEKKYYRKLDPGQQHIWSSVTLYDTVTMNKRKSWFQEWIIKNAEPGWEEVMNFHLKSGDGDVKNDLLMNREDKVSTMSITSTVITPDLISMNHLDIQTEKLSTQNLTIHKVITIK
ncbi:MAG TPA: hypothetical protein VFV08_08030, partial [Puia sp.]|nr:hypothetical protein [Puia sp.]